MSQSDQRRSSKQSSGVALISVLLIVALVSTIASQMISQHSLTIAHTSQVFNATQAREYAIGAEMFARQLLFEDWFRSRQSSDIDTLQENWAEPNAPFEIDKAVLEMTIRDLDGRLNLNGVVGQHGPETMQRLKRILNNLSINPNIADAWLDWVDENHEVHGFGAEDSEYLAATTPYRTANQLGASISELLAITNVGTKEFTALKRHTTVLPTNASKINVNTAGYEVLRSLSPNVSAMDVSNLVDSTREFKDISSVTAQYPSLGGVVSALKVESEYFEVQVRVDSRTLRCELTSLLYRDPSNGKIRLLERDFGRRYEKSLAHVAG